MTSATTNRDLQARLSALLHELDRLQREMNRNVDQIRDLIVSHEVDGALVAYAGAAPAGMPVVYTPALLSLPQRNSYLQRPMSGQALGDGCRMYGDFQNALVQSIQLPGRGEHHGRYTLTVNYADFDGTWLSLVFDLRGAIAGLSKGSARLAARVLVGATPAFEYKARLAVKMGGETVEKPFAAHSGIVAIDTLELAEIDPQQVEVLDLHLIFNPPRRGSLELRELSLSAFAHAAPEAPVGNVFEAVPSSDLAV